MDGLITILFVLYQGQREQMSSRLGSKESRKEWEDTFNQVYIQPVLEVTFVVILSQLHLPA